MQRIEPVGIVARGLASAAGSGMAALAGALRSNRSALTPYALPGSRLQTWVGAIPGIDAVRLPPALAAWDCRAMRAAWLGLQADGFADAVRVACGRHGAHRVGLLLGTSASTIAVSEAAYRAPAADGGFPLPLRSESLNTLHAVTAFVQQALGVAGPCATVSTACSSSAKVFAQGERWLRLELCDAVVVGGVDVLSASLLFGFHALGLLSAEPCRPFDVRRAGISIGEAAGFALLERGGAAPGLIGYGESNDAHHMSSPHPQGLGAAVALDAALARAGIAAADVDHVNLHGTASARNDAVEAALVAGRYADGTHACATKGVTGHTMGAAGIVEALACLLALDSGLNAGSVGCSAPDPAFGAAFAARLQTAPRQRAARIAASHSFGFGGNNAVLLFAAG